ncbi:MAG: cupin domain-containing protein [Chloroflexi bacterium]|nr:cupin domain-containing protein [Chloroflexota bacterium]
MSNYQILRFQELPVRDRGSGVQATMLVHQGLGATGLTSGITRFPPGGQIALHYHNCDETVVILEGEAIAEVDGTRYPLTRWDTTFVKAGVPHCFMNAGDQPMAILWTYTSSQVTRTFVETGQTVQHWSPGDRAVVTRE